MGDKSPKNKEKKKKKQTDKKGKKNAGTISSLVDKKKAPTLFTTGKLEGV